LTPGTRVAQVIRDAVFDSLVFSDRSFPITAAKWCSNLDAVKLRLAARDMRLQASAHVYRYPTGP